MSDFVTGFYTKDGVKKYDYNSLANLPESGTDITNTVISPNADYAEVGEWADGNPDGENRLGYFVAIAEVGDNTIKIRKATSEDDVRGVSVYNPAFSGNASRDKYGADGELLQQYNYIGVMGIVKTIDNGRCAVGGRCMPDDDGTAIPSTNSMGYAVLERVDSRHVLIAVEPGADMIQRVKTAVKKIEEQLEEGGGGGSGENGATFTPSVSSEGVLSWTNDKGLPNPEPINIKGADGKTPYIQGDYWYIDGKSTGVKAEGADGEDGIGISKAEINADGELVLTYTDGNIVNLGKVVGEDGDDAEGGGLTPEQLVQFNELVDWYNESTYTTMTASISPSTSTYEIGSKKTITFTWSFKVGTNAAELSSLTFGGNTVSVTQTSATVENITSTSSYEVKGTRADGKKEEKSAKANVYFYNKYYFGCDVDPQISPTSSTKDLEYSNFIKGSATWNGLKLKSDWANSRKTFTITPNCPDGSYIWYAYPTRLGTSTFKMNGLPADFNVQIINFTNGSSYSEDYYLYRSIEPSLGSIEIQIL